MKRLFILIPVLLVAWGCNKPADPGLQQIIYQNNQNNSQSNEQTPNQEEMTIKTAVIAIDDNGKNGAKVGCNDSVVFVEHKIPATTQPLNEAMKKLFAYRSQIVVDTNNNDKEYYTALPQMSALKFDRAAIEDGTARIYLTGSMAGLGGVCDSPRVPAQIEGTAKQFPTVKQVETYLNGTRVDWEQFSSQK